MTPPRIPAHLEDVSTLPARQPSGVRAGGQFAATPHAEATVDLGDLDTCPTCSGGGALGNGAPCPACRGTGGLDEDGWTRQHRIEQDCTFDCTACDQTGLVADAVTCAACDGRGQITDYALAE